jgi:hypothetical protein
MKAGWDDDCRAAQAQRVAERNRRRINRLGVSEGYEDLYRLFRSKRYPRDQAIRRGAGGGARTEGTRHDQSSSGGRYDP